MTLTQKSRHEQGFTLVELAIVMVIIGILIGGILKGQELIANSKISSTVSQVKGLDAAVNTFQDKYNAIPGDMGPNVAGTSPATRLPGCTLAPCNAAGNGNGQFGNVAGAQPAVADEGVVAFTHLSAADLISGIDPTGSAVSFGRMLPIVKAGGGMWLGQSNNLGGATATAGNTLDANRSYASLAGVSTAALAANNGALSAIAAAQIDRKIDDGIGNTGTIQGVCNNWNTANIVYDEDNKATVCSLYARIQN